CRSRRRHRSCTCVAGCTSRGSRAPCTPSSAAARTASSSRRRFPRVSTRSARGAYPKELSMVNERGYYGRFGGMYVPEILVATFEELIAAFEDVRRDPAFW